MEAKTNKLPKTDNTENLGGISNRLANIYTVKARIDEINTSAVISDYDWQTNTVFNDTGNTFFTKELQVSTSGFLNVAASGSGYGYPCVGCYAVIRHNFGGIWCVFDIGKFVSNSAYVDLDVSIDSNGFLKITAKGSAAGELRMYYSFKRNLCL